MDWARIWSVVHPLLVAAGATLIGGATLTAIAHWLFKNYTTRWLDSRFAKDLEEYRQKHQIELQRLRLEIDVLLDRSIKLHGREFESLPQAWSMLDDAYHSALATSMAYLQYPDLDRMDHVQREDFLEKQTELPDWAKDEVRCASDKSRRYADFLQRLHLNRANKMRQEFHSFVLKNGIFFPDEIRVQFLDLNQMMIEALVEREVHMTPGGGGTKFIAASALGDQGRKKLEKLQGDIQKRLRSASEG